MFRRTSLQSLSLRGCHKHAETGGDTATTNANTGRRSGSGAPPPTVTINTRFSPMTFLPKIDFFKKKKRKRRGLRRFVLCNRVTCTKGTVFTNEGSWQSVRWFEFKKQTRASQHLAPASGHSVPSPFFDFAIFVRSLNPRRHCPPVSLNKSHASDPDV